MMVGISGSGADSEFFVLDRRLYEIIRDSKLEDWDNHVIYSVEQILKVERKMKRRQKKVSK
jgi:hypothetical protein